MSAALIPRTNTTANDRLSVTIFLALAFHAIIILGISFDYEDDNTNEKEA